LDHLLPTILSLASHSLSCIYLSLNCREKIKRKKKDKEKKPRERKLRER
jgi:hypothetical protein